LEDDRTIESYKITEKDFLVLMVRQPKGDSSSASATTTSAPAASPAPTSTPAPSTPAVQPTAPSTPLAPPASHPASRAETPHTPSLTPVPATEAINRENNEIVNRICDMGFPRDSVLRAMRAAFNNADRAVEYLMMEEIPDTEDPLPPVGVTGAVAGGGGNAPASPTLHGNLFEMAAQQAQQQANEQASRGGGPFDFLRQHPQFYSLRQLVQTQPHLLQNVLETLAASNPQIMQLINQNQAEFIRLLNEPVPPGTPSFAAPAGAGGAPAGNPGMQYIQVSPEEKESIERLEALGFDRALVIEAFLSCDKNETLAANYLLEHGFEMQDDSMDDGGDQDYA